MPSPDQIVIPVGPLQLVFAWQGDRYGHRVELPRAPEMQPGRALCLLQSEEGQPDEIWPPSPPLQECHLESRPNECTVALLVGRAGTSHWSLSVLCDPHSGRMTFEAACRLRGESGSLGSSYRFPKRDPRPGDVEAVLEGPAGEPIARLCEPWQLDSSEPPERLDSVHFLHADDSGTGPRTVQWSYVIHPVIFGPAVPQ